MNAQEGKNELDAFLASRPPWMQRFFQFGFGSLDQNEILEWTNGLNEVFSSKSEYERILRQIPVKWRDYCKRLKREARQSFQFEAQFLVPKGKAGAPRKDELAQQAGLLQGNGMSLPQIATQLNKTLEEGNKTNADALRKLLKRRSHPDKT
jgi:hypothetical protein